ncbi:MAG: BamA/TamA family outer membrane protein [Deltaproteobacteria bacterium]|nr:BamA/TamA family outer membrane protein [Deltaproteobacteria bacterium]MCB9787456.1 BamA/TamA family outer membrane protein [Deltaproteobacteria bacterium]
MSLPQVPRRRGAPVPNSRWILVAASLLAFLLAQGCHGRIRLGRWHPPEGEKIIGDVSVHGNDLMRDRAIEAELETHSDNWKFGSKPLLHRADLAQDAQRIVSMYAAHGYFHARVTGYHTEPIDEYAVRVHFDVDEGEPAHVTEVRFLGLAPQESTGAEAAKRLEELTPEIHDAVPFDEGDVWEQEPYEQAKRDITKLLTDAGFAHATVLGEVAVSKVTDQVEVRMLIVPGPLVRVSEVIVKGNDMVPTDRILRRVELSVGDIAEGDLMRGTERGLQELGVFFSVSVQLDRPTTGDLLDGKAATYATLRALDWPVELPLVVEVQEMPPREFRAGLGASIDNVRSEAFLSGGLRYRNFFGNQRYFDVEARPALIVLPTFFGPQRVGPGLNLNAEFRQHSVLEEYIQFRGEIDYALDLALGYQSHVTTFSAALSRRFLDFLTVEVGYSLEWYRYFQVSDSLQLTREQTLGVDFRDAYILGFLEQVFTADKRDSAFDTRQGGFAELRLQESSRAFGSDKDFPYIRVQTDLRAYLQVASWLTLAWRARYAQTFPLQNSKMPLAARFFGGGSSDVRGYSSRTMGPIVCENDPSIETTSSEGQAACKKGDRIYVGGNVALLGSFETRFYLPANFGLVAFVDVGEVWSTIDDVNLANLQIAVGPGLRYLTPFGPLRVDLGFLLTGTTGTNFTFHFSIGQAF